MMTESDVIDAVCRHLRRKGWRIESRCAETERGYDIVAVHRASGRRAVVEAKGGTSSKRYTNRFGQEFSPNQATSHISRALFTAIRGMKRGTLSAMAFPKNEAHLKRVGSIRHALRRLRLEVFWVGPSGKVEAEGFWTT